MNIESTDVSQPPAAKNQQAAAELGDSSTPRRNATAKVGDNMGGAANSNEAPQRASQTKAPVKEVSQAKLALKKRLPGLADDGDVGVQKEQIITRDGKADLGFTGALLASAAPELPPKEEWKEYRIYHTNGGKHVFSKVTRTVWAGEEDSYEAEVFDPSPSSMPSKLLKSAHDLTHTRPMTWMDAAVNYFGYDPLAKVLYRKLSVGFEEQIS